MNKVTLVIHASNVYGLGARELVENFLPGFIQKNDDKDIALYFPVDHLFGGLPRPSDRLTYIPVSRYLPKKISRFLEVFFWKFKSLDADITLVLGDLPLNTRGRQVLFLQQAHLVNPIHYSLFDKDEMLFNISRVVFRMYLRKVSDIVVQTEVMEDRFRCVYPQYKGRVNVINPPVSDRLFPYRGLRTCRQNCSGNGLSLFYPASNYRHKNHELLLNVVSTPIEIWSKIEIILTIDSPLFDDYSFVSCIGSIGFDLVIEYYKSVDAVLFLSKEESYGYPLVEAMYVGLPIICADLPYARYLCGDEAIYFDPNNIISLKSAIDLLDKRLKTGWWPDWTGGLGAIDMDWGRFQEHMANIVFET